MSRYDDIGFFWADIKAIKESKPAPVKRVPPDRVWEREDYLPGLDKARAFKIPEFTDLELLAACKNEEPLSFDIEIYRNYSLFMFTSQVSGKVVYFDMDDEPCGLVLDKDKLYWVLKNFCIVTFNGWKYDIPVTTLALAGADCDILKNVSDEIIQQKIPGYHVLKRFKVGQLKGLNHIDLMEVAPSACSLKQYAARMGAPRLQGLPFHPRTILSEDQKCILRWYCCIDLEDTTLLTVQLNKQLDLRAVLSAEQKTDVRSKSDPQIAEVVIGNELKKLGYKRIKIPVIDPGTKYKFKVPGSIKFQTPILKEMLEVIRGADFYVNDGGKISMPKVIKEFKVDIAGTMYKIGIGGLHSKEKAAAYVATKDLMIIDRDADSFYPNIKILTNLYPAHIGPDYIRVYAPIIKRRIKAKKEKRKIEADTLKITGNGAFGKHGNVYSILYAPMNVVQITVSGQLFLLMLIERFELAGFKVVSANTDGVAFLCPTARYDEANAIVTQWEHDTGFTTEETRYKALYSRDVNNYLALKDKGGYKGKGVFANPWDANNPDPNELLKHNPTNLVCLEAVIAYLDKQTPIAETIEKCQDTTKFVSVRDVKGGAVKDGVYLGKAIRWYYAIGETGEIIYASNGHKVARTDNAKPLMDLPDRLPDDIDYGWYIAESENLLSQINPDNLLYQESE